MNPIRIISIACCTVSLQIFAHAGVDSSAKKAVEKLKSPDGAEQRQAKQELRTFRFSDLTRLMEEFAHDKNPDIRILMTQTIGEIGGFEAVHSLKKLFGKEKDARVRRSILLQLSGLIADEKEAFDYLSGVALKDSDGENRFLALSQLSLVASDASLRRKLVKICRKIWNKDESRKNRVMAAVILAETSTDEDSHPDALFEALQSQSVELRRRAALLVSSQNHPDTFTKVSAAIQDPDPEVRANLSKSLGDTMNPNAVPILKSLALDKDPQVRANAVSALGVMPLEMSGLDPFLTALDDIDAGVRSAAVSVLERKGNVTVLPRLETLAQKDLDSSVRLLAKKAIAAIATQKK